MDRPQTASTPTFCGIAVMAKASKPGRTKTRLSSSVGSADAARLNTAFLQDIADSLIRASQDASIKGYMAYGPPGEGAFFDILPSAIGRFAAWRPSFGETLAGTIADLLDKGHGGAIVLNADSPTLPTSILVEAARILAGPGDHVVLGPSFDGGYYLLGMKRLHPRLFEDITWSTEHVARETRERAAEIAVAVRSLPEWYDVDDEASLATLRAELSGSRRFGPPGLLPAPAHHTRALLAEIDALGPLVADPIAL